MSLYSGQHVSKQKAIVFDYFLVCGNKSFARPNDMRSQLVLWQAHWLIRSACMASMVIYVSSDMPLFIQDTQDYLLVAI